MSVGEHVERASALSSEARTATAAVMNSIDRSSVAWTFLARAYDELMRAVENFKVAAANLGEAEKR